MNPGKVFSLIFLVLSLTSLGGGRLYGAVPVIGEASWYDSQSVKREGTCHEEKCFTASGKEIGELEQKGVKFCASNDYKFGTKLKVLNIKNGKSVQVVVMDRGGFKKYGRSVDLSKSAFAEIASTRDGIIKVKIEKVGFEKLKRRSYHETSKNKRSKTTKRSVQAISALCAKGNPAPVTKIARTAQETSALTHEYNSL